MGITECIRMAIKSLGASKGRTILTMIGMVIGTASVVAIVSLGLGGRAFVISQIQGLGSNLVYAYRDSSRRADRKRASDSITIEDVEAIKREIRGIKSIVPITFTKESLNIGNSQYRVSIMGTTSSYKPVRNLKVTKGRFLSADDVRSRQKVCVLTEKLSKKIFPKENPVGKSIRIQRLKFTVIGVFKEGVITTAGESEVQQDSLVMPISVAGYFRKDSDTVGLIWAQAKNSSLIPSVMKDIKNVLERRHHEGATYKVESFGRLMQVASDISLGLTATIGLIAGISLIVGGVGIMNIMLVTVSERTREIGVRMAIGADRLDIRRQFLIEAVVLSLLGGIIGMFLGSIAPLTASYFLSFPVPVSFIAAGLAIGISLFIGVSFGIYPAKKASLLDPIEALRHE